MTTLIGAYAAEPVLRELAARHVRVHLVTYPKVAAKIQSILPESDLKIHDLSKLVSRHRWLAKWHAFLVLLLTPPNFSQKYSVLVEAKRLQGGRGLLGYGLAKFPLKLRREKINRALKVLVEPFLRNPFPTETVMAITMHTHAYLLCGRGARVVTLIESWDHGVKFPVGFPSNLAFLWNEELCRNWTEYQGDTRVRSLYPLKLRDSITKGQEGNFTVSREPHGVIMYAAGTSSVVRLNGTFEEELKVIREVILAAAEVGFQVYIKPRPNGRVGDFDHFEKEFPNVSIGIYRQAKTTSDYYLDREYTDSRFNELLKADLVVNTYTTFALDAAVSGWPVLQLNLTGNLDYPNMAGTYGQEHLQMVFFKDPDDNIVIRSGDSVREAVKSYLSKRDGRENRFSIRLRDWAVPNEDLITRTKNAVDEILANHS